MRWTIKPPRGSVAAVQTGCAGIVRGDSAAMSGANGICFYHDNATLSTTGCRSVAFSLCKRGCREIPQGGSSYNSKLASKLGGVSRASQCTNRGCSAKNVKLCQCFASRTNEHKKRPNTCFFLFLQASIKQNRLLFFSFSYSM